MLCIMDVKARSFNDADCAILRLLRDLVVTELEAFRTATA